MRQGRYVRSPLAAHRRGIITVTPAATSGSRLAVDARRRRGDARHLHAIGPPHPVTIGSEASLLERALELEVLNTAVARLAGGAGGIVVLGAPAGLGKTALLEHAVREAAEAGCRRAPRRSGPARAPLRVRRGARTAGGTAARRVGRAARAPARRGGRAGRRPAARRGRARARDATMAIAHSVLWLCSALADDAPLVLVVDDAHWADRAVARGARLPRAADRRAGAAHRHRRPRGRSRRGRPTCSA